jgi:hypothetical protein
METVNVRPAGQSRRAAISPSVLGVELSLFSRLEWPPPSGEAISRRCVVNLEPTRPRAGDSSFSLALPCYKLSDQRRTKTSSDQTPAKVVEGTTRFACPIRCDSVMRIAAILWCCSRRRNHWVVEPSPTRRRLPRSARNTLRMRCAVASTERPNRSEFSRTSSRSEW